MILFLGRFDPRNGLTTLIESFQKVRGRNRQAQLVVVGDGPLRNHYYRAVVAIRTEPSSARCCAIGHGYYAHSAIVCSMPDDEASFGITLLEVMACETRWCAGHHGFATW